MIRKSKKLFLGLLSLGAIFVIAGCGQNQASDQNANNAQQEQKVSNNLSGEWESVNELDSIQKILFQYKLHFYTLAKYIEAFKDFKMKLSVDGSNAKLSYQYDSKIFAKANYGFSNETNKTEVDKFVSQYVDLLAVFVLNFKKYNVSIDISTGTFSYEATGTVNEKAKSVTFDEGLIILNSFPLTTAGKEHWFDSTTYNYEVKDGILTIYTDMKTKDNLPARFELKFKRVPSTEKK